MTNGPPPDPGSPVSSRAQVWPTPLPRLIDGQQGYMVRRLLKVQPRVRRFQYLVDWEGYGLEEKCWVPARDILDPGLIAEFQSRNPDTCNLTISKTEPWDSATHYCGAMEVGEVKFGEGTVLIVKGSNSMSVLQQSVSESVQQGDSVTLNCTIHTETCAGEHSVYWFRHGSGESHPGIIYNIGDRSDQCEKSPEARSPRQSCVYNLPKRNLSLSDAGTYYCAVASCGEILFGNGTKLSGMVTFDSDSQMRILVLLYIIRTGVLLCCLTILIIIYTTRK
ncbi:uncharacterized protein LOC123482858 [Coregonus clupeaformis]|uniref:uncharacterized protein LOC123482858 n=1 Tax=Coregonus clupeaformis TaxID=59861 RepID=UPI001E1C5D5E|nr:uncharacterized protein LOC123482858 [Coregonus clupeaformis]